jgi:uncharacterized membrane protein
MEKEKIMEETIIIPMVVLVVVATAIMAEEDAGDADEAEKDAEDADEAEEVAAEEAATIVRI